MSLGEIAQKDCDLGSLGRSARIQTSEEGETAEEGADEERFVWFSLRTV